MKTAHILASYFLMNRKTLPNTFVAGNGKSDNETLKDKEVLQDENLEDEELPDEKPHPSDEGISYVPDDINTYPDKAESTFETNNLDEK